MKKYTLHIYSGKNEEKEVVMTRKMGALGHAFIALYPI